MQKRGFIFGVVLVLIAASLTAFTGNGPALPMDTHEVFVARTAEEMLARHSFIVPWLNDQLRLKKPPLCYWLVMGVDRINGGDGVITETEARLPSAIAGVIMALLTAALGSIVGGRWVGMLAGLVLASTSSFVTYTHSARPEMVYAMLCTGALLGFAMSYQRLNPLDSGRRSPGAARWFAWLGWLMLGLATLAKGPQIPAIIIAGWIFALLILRRRGDVLPTLRPFTGLIIMLAVSLWWYMAIKLAIPNAAAVWQQETGDRFFNSREPLSRYLDPYYLYRTAQIMLPWAALFFAGAIAPFMRELKSSLPLRITWWTVVIAMIGLSISLGRRDYYMLPMTGAVAVVMAMGGRWLGEVLIRDNKAWIWKAGLALHATALGAAIFAIHRTEPDISKPPMWALAAAPTAAALALGVIFVKLRSPADRRIESQTVSFAAVLCVSAVLFAGAAARGSLWQNDRVPRRQFCLDVRAAVPAGEQLLGWGDIWEVEQFYNHRVIPSFKERDELTAQLDEILQRRPGACWLLVDGRVDPRRKVLKLPRDFQSEVVIKAADGDKPDVLQLWKITASR